MECVQMDGEMEKSLWTLQAFSAERNIVLCRPNSIFNVHHLPQCQLT